MENGTSGPGGDPGQFLAAGDPRREQIGRAIFGTLLAAAVFSVTVGPAKQIRVLYDHAPWLNDPYDTVVSFAMFFVPSLTACCLGRVLLCRRSAPLPAARVRDLLRGCRVVLGAIVITLVTEWIAVAAGANSPNWNSATWLQVAILALTTVLSATAVAAVYRVPVVAAGPAAAGTAVDWLADAFALAARYSHRPGRAGRRSLWALTWADTTFASRVRRHPLWAAGICAVAFGAVVGGWQALREGYLAGAAVLTITVLACGSFALLVGAGGYLGLVRSEDPLAGAARRLLDAAVLMCAGVVVALALRNSLFWVIGSTAALAGLPQLALLLGIAALTSFAVVFAAETVLGSHRSPASE